MQQEITPCIHQITLRKTAAEKKGACVALGFFDGVHIGHLALFDEARKQAAEQGPVFAVFTFRDCGDGTYKAGAPRLTEWNERLTLFRDAGVERVYAADFSSVATLSPEEFVDEVLIRRLDAVFAVCGFNFRFGHMAAADSSVLSRLMHERSRGCLVLSPTEKEGTAVSSTAIRAAIENGQIELANSMLGRPFTINFPVIHGKMLGRTIGVPTINQTFPHGFVIPRRGVYACLCDIDGETHAAVSNVGVRPTMEDTDAVNCESHILDFDGWLYGRRIRVSFLHFLREERQFENLDALVAQIHKDIEEARKRLPSPSNEI